MLNPPPSTTHHPPRTLPTTLPRRLLQSIHTMEGAGKAAAPRLLTLLRYCNEHVSQAAFSPDAEPSPPPQLSPATSSPATIHDEDGDHRGRTHVRHPVEETAKPAEDTQLDQIMTLRAKYDSLVAVHDSLLVQLELSNKRCDVLEAQLQAMRRVEKFLRQDDHSETSSLPTRGDSAVPLSENSAAGGVFKSNPLCANGANPIQTKIPHPVTKSTSSPRFSPSTTTQSEP